MLTVVYIIFFINYITAYDGLMPSCASCRSFIKNKNNDYDYGYCKIYKNKHEHNGQTIQLYEYAKHCRDNTYMCGPEGYLYEPIKYSDNTYEIHDVDVSDITKMTAVDEMKENKEIENLFDEYTNKCCGEICEKDDLIELEKDYINLIKKIKSINKKNLKKLNKNIYNFLEIYIKQL